MFTSLCITIFCLSILSCFSKSISASQSFEDKIESLQAEPDYRAIRLKWIYNIHGKDVEGFEIRYCEHGVWHIRTRCRRHEVSLNQTTTTNNTIGDEAIVQLYSLSDHRFEALMSNLRMLTTYSIMVVVVHNKQDDHQLETDVGDFNLRKSFQNSSDSIMVETKSFSAQTCRCLANSSEMKVFTGPYFSGKISVEGTHDPECSIYGDRQSSQSVYNFVINHNLCGSRVINNSRIETMVIVHENKEILTHNSRRYFVVCTFNEVQTLTASVAVPKHLLKKYFDRLKEVRPSANSVTSSQLDKSNASRVERFVLARPITVSHLRYSRMLTENAKVKLIETTKTLQASSATSNAVLIAYGLVLSIFTIGVYLLCAGKLRLRRQT